MTSAHELYAPIFGDTTAGTASISNWVLASVGQTPIGPGFVVDGPGIQAGTIITAVTSSTLTLSLPAQITNPGGAFDAWNEWTAGNVFGGTANGIDDMTSIAYGGTGYTNAETVVALGGVTAPAGAPLLGTVYTAGGVVTGFAASDSLTNGFQGDASDSNNWYSVLPTVPCPVTGGHGSGALFDLTMNDHVNGNGATHNSFATGIGVATVVNGHGGSLYQVGDVLTLSHPANVTPGGVAATLTVTAVDGSGAILAVNVTTAGAYTTDNPATLFYIAPLPGGAGSGAILSWQALQTSVPDNASSSFSPDAAIANGGGYAMGDVLAVTGPASFRDTNGGTTTTWTNAPILQVTHYTYSSSGPSFTYNIINTPATSTGFFPVSSVSFNLMPLGYTPATVVVGPYTLNGAGVNGGVAEFVAGATVNFGPQVFAPFGSSATVGSGMQIGSGTTILTAAETYTGTTMVNGGTLLVDGSLTGPTTVGASGTLGGTGVLSGPVDVSGTLAAGDPTVPSNAALTADLTFHAGSKLHVHLSGPSAGTGFAQVKATGPVTLTGASLDLSMDTSFAPAMGTMFDILVNNSGSAITGTFTQGSTITLPTATFSISYTGGVSGHDVVLTVTSTPLIVTGTQLTPSGIMITFNQPVNPAVTHVYNNSAGDPATVTLTGASGPVEGSLVFSNNNQTAYFVQTANVLAAGAYTLNINSTATGIETPGGELLSGTYQTSYTVASSTAPVVSMFDFARGPGEVDGVGYIYHNGMPLTISNGLNLTSAAVTINYNPALWQPTGATTALTGYSVTGFTANNTTGVATFTVSGGAALPSGAATLATIQYTIPTTAPYFDKAAIQPTVVVNGGAITVQNRTAVDEAAYVGDVVGGHSVNSFDATGILKETVGVAGFASYPDLDPKLIANGADVAGTVSAQDATNLLIATVSTYQYIPIDNTAPTSTGTDPKLYFEFPYQAVQGETLTATLYMNITAADLTGPSGNGTQFNFQSADLNFVITNVPWLNSSNAGLIVTNVAATGAATGFNNQFSVVQDASNPTQIDVRDGMATGNNNFLGAGDYAILTFSFIIPKTAPVGNVSTLEPVANLGTPTATNGNTSEVNPYPPNPVLNNTITIILGADQPPFDKVPQASNIPTVLFNPAAQAGLQTKTPNTLAFTGNGLDGTTPLTVSVVENPPAPLTMPELLSVIGGVSFTTTVSLAGDTTGTLTATGSGSSTTVSGGAPGTALVINSDYFNPATFTLTGNTHSTTTVDGLSSTAMLYVGQPVSGAGIPAGDTIATIAGPTSITLTTAASATATGVTLTFTGSFDLNNTLATLVYTPGAGFFGNATLSVSTTDNLSASNAPGLFGGPLTDTHSTTITVVGLFLSEINLNKANTTNPSQYLEVFSTIPNYLIPGTHATATATSAAPSIDVVGINGTVAGTGTPAPGLVTDIFNLSGFTTGSNGYLALLEKANNYSALGDLVPFGIEDANGGTGAGFGSLATSIIGPATGVHQGGTSTGRLATDMLNQAESFLLIQVPSTGTAPTITTNIDPTSTGTPNQTTAYGTWNVLDSVGFLSTTSTNTSHSYAAVTFDPTASTGTTLSGSIVVSTATWTPNYMGRTAGSTGSSSTAWLASMLAGTPAAGFTLGTNSTMFAGAALNTVGGPNNWAPQESVVVNDGSSNQHSQVGELTVNFTGPVNIANLATDFEVLDASGTALTVTYFIGGAAATGAQTGVTQLVISFAGGTDQFAFGVPQTDANGNVMTDGLNDGNYFLFSRVNDITSTGAPSVFLDGAHNGMSGSFTASDASGNHFEVDQFWRMFGDTQGRREVSHADLALFDHAFGSTSGAANYVWYLDYGVVGMIGSLDLTQFLLRLHTKLAAGSAPPAP
jgi:autotransporter-associated beta strand protein